MLGTLVEGSPSSIRGAADFLDNSLSVGARDFGDSILTASSKISDGWQGLAGEACLASLAKGRASLNGIQDQAASRASDVRWLADELESVLATLANARTIARANGLDVVLTTIYRPSIHPQIPVSSQPYQQYQRRMTTWRWVQSEVARAKARWERAVRSFNETWVENSSSLVGVTVDLFDTAVTSGVLANNAYKLVAKRNLLLNHLQSAQRSLSAAVDAGGKATVPRPRYYELVDEIDSLKSGVNATNDAMKNGLRVGSKVSKGLLVLGVAGTGYSIYDDIQSGESVEQAVVSNAAGFAAGMATGAVTGAVVGSFIVPPAGTVVGAVVGGVVGAGVGLFTSGAIDHLYENAAASIGSTIAAGFQEIGDTAAAVGDLVSGAWNSIFG